MGVPQGGDAKEHDSGGASIASVRRDRNAHDARGADCCGAKPKRCSTTFRASTAFLTRLPPEWLGPTAGARPDFRRAARVFPLVGVLVGVVGGAVLVIGRVAAHSAPGLRHPCGACDMIFTGGLHEDGLADTVDGFGGGATAARKLEIMDDSRIGTFGVAAVVFSILLRVAALVSLIPLGAFRAAPGAGRRGSRCRAPPWCGSGRSFRPRALAASPTRPARPTSRQWLSRWLSAS